MRRRHGRAAEILDDLEREHQHGDEELAAVRKSLEVYAREGATGFDQFKAAALAFRDLQSRHVMKEEVQILPLAEEYLTDEDWASIDAAFADHDDPLFGDKEKVAFGELFSKIVEMAPAPYGLGPPAASYGSWLDRKGDAGDDRIGTTLLELVAFDLHGERIAKGNAARRHGRDQGDPIDQHQGRGRTSGPAPEGHPEAALTAAYNPSRS